MVMMIRILIMSHGREWLVITFPSPFTSKDERFIFPYDRAAENMEGKKMKQMMKNQ